MAGISYSTGTGPLIGSGFYPSASQSAQNYINVIHRDILPGVIYQGVRKARPSLRMLLSKTHKPLRGGWAPIVQTVAFQTFGNNFSWTGFNGNFTIPTLTNPLQSMQFLPSLGVVPISYLLTEAVIMDSPQVAVDVITQRVADGYQTMLDTLNASILGTAGTNSQAMLGLLDAVDNGTNQTTYGGLSRSTYSALNSQIYANAIPSTTPAYQVIHTYLMSFLQDVNQRLPDIGLTSFAVFNALTTSLTNIERVNVQDSKDILTQRDWAVQVVSVDGIPIMPDPTITSNTIYFLNLEKLHFGSVPQLNFKLTEPSSLQPVGQLGYVQTAMTAGQFYTFSPNAHFALTSAPSSTLY